MTDPAAAGGGIAAATKAARIGDVRARLDQIRDPELDEPVTAMGFIQAIEIAGDDVRVMFQLPTAWCAANFAYLMAVDMKAAVAALPWVASVEIVLLEHFAARRINEAVGQDLSFVAAFPQKAEAELDDLRQTFLEKAFLARQHAVLAALSKPVAILAADWSIADLERQAGESEALGAAAARYLALRRSLPGQRAFVTAGGEAVAAADWPVHLREIRRTAMTLAANAEHCRVLASARTA
ncbi:iron-sulfur cluster assembly protein [Kaistia adipata]|uniref:iron-sulfur cluster assembly protein n=1 Tax=Kaistia adipata TaxID=166954 RepID=UPI00041E777B|nr:iron-sulfur cluster assembly protein [Kaistia adipata]